ncbi:DHA2 family efflux MFS transporter permease subunit [Aquihabitans sp. McL0605]|uniref:DHA2 family efflux MFS transporter permease subunit n=1 Tax=Aquihabitans sp. McL0605 TaxID=3415671 RepID=UPI003CEF1CB4
MGDAGSATADDLDRLSTDELEAEGAIPSDPNRWTILGVLCLALLIVGIDGTIVNVALPTLVRDIGASSSELQWIVDAYTIIFASTLLIAGNTGDRLGRKWTLIVGLVIFGCGSLACSQAGSAHALIAMRAVQGLGAAFIMPSTLSILTNVFGNPAERARAISIWAGVSGLGVAIGPLAGGYLLEHFWWGSIFLVNVPIVIIAVIAASVLVPNSKDAHPQRLDIIGTLLSLFGLVAMLFAIIEGPSRGWTDPVILVCGAAALVLLTSFVLWERHTDHPILDVTFFKNPRFSAASVAVTLVFFAMFGAMFFVTQYLQFVLGFSALKSGACLMPIALALMVAAPLSAKLVGRFGTKIVVATGLGLVGLALLIFSRVTVTSGYPLVALVLVIVGVGMGFAMAPATDSIMGSLPPSRAGVGSAVNDTTREIGGALGVAILGSVTAAVYTSQIRSNPNYEALAKASPEAAKAVSDSVGSASIVGAHLPAQAAQLITDAANEAFVVALQHTVIVGALVAFAGAVVAAVWLPARPVSADEDATEGIEDLVATSARSLPNLSRRDLAGATLDLLAEAGFSSLSFSGIATRSGVSTNNLDRYWGSRVDAVVDAVNEVFAQHPVEDTGDIVDDLNGYAESLREVIDTPKGRAVLGSLIAAAANDPVLDAELRRRLVEPRREQLVGRIDRAVTALQLPPSTDIQWLADAISGPIWLRALVTRDPLDAEFTGHLVDEALRVVGVAGPVD